MNQWGVYIGLEEAKAVFLELAKKYDGVLIDFEAFAQWAIAQSLDIGLGDMSDVAKFTRLKECSARESKSPRKDHPTPEHCTPRRHSGPRCFSMRCSRVRVRVCVCVCVCVARVRVRVRVSD